MLSAAHKTLFSRRAEKGFAVVRSDESWNTATFVFSREIDEAEEKLKSMLLFLMMSEEQLAPIVAILIPKIPFALGEDAVVS